MWRMDARMGGAFLFSPEGLWRWALLLHHLAGRTIGAAQDVYAAALSAEGFFCRVGADGRSEFLAGEGVHRHGHA